MAPIKQVKGMDVSFNREKLPACSVVLPCLNEAGSLARVLRSTFLIAAEFEDLEVIVVDNGSDDGSADVARGYAGVRVVDCPQRGYGRAIRAGIEASRNEIVIFADADGTYDLSEAPALARSLRREAADLVVGNRLRGKMDRFAMPALHRYFGTPLLSALITFRYGRERGVRIGDCNGGMRALKKSAYTNWQMRASGMEFASEMIVQALLSGATYAEVPISYHRPGSDRQSHLRPLRDGFRHLRLILER